MLTVALSIFGTLVVVLVVRNFRKPEKEPRHRVKRSYDIKSPQLKREMGALLGPTIVPGNSVQALENGDEIFPSMLAPSVQQSAASRWRPTFIGQVPWASGLPRP
jgi:cardiolipin synthase